MKIEFWVEIILDTILIAGATFYVVEFGFGTTKDIMIGGIFAIIALVQTARTIFSYKKAS